MSNDYNYTKKTFLKSLKLFEEINVYLEKNSRFSYNIIYIV